LGRRSIPAVIAGRANPEIAGFLDLRGARTAMETFKANRAYVALQMMP
jgi:hypothetical protein